MAQVLKLPRLSDTMTEGVLVRWHKNEGDRVEPGDVLAEVETDKATMELESFDSGVLSKHLLQEGQRVPVGGALAIIADEDDENISGDLSGQGASARQKGDRLKAVPIATNIALQQDEPGRDIVALPSNSVERRPSATEARTRRDVDPKRIISDDSWAMLVAIGDYVDDEIVTPQYLADCADKIIGRMYVTQGIKGDPLAYNVSPGDLIDREIRANGTELWVRFDSNVASLRPRRRAVLGPDPRQPGLVIAAAPHRPHAGDREQRDEARDLSTNMLQDTSTNSNEVDSKRDLVLGYLQEVLEWRKSDSDHELWDMPTKVWLDAVKLLPKEIAEQPRFQQTLQNSSTRMLTIRSGVVRTIVALLSDVDDLDLFRPSFFDIHLSYDDAPADLPLVDSIVGELRNEHLRVWRDIWPEIPQMLWRGKGNWIKYQGALLVVVRPEGIRANWQLDNLKTLLPTFQGSGRPVIVLKSPGYIRTEPLPLELDKMPSVQIERTGKSWVTEIKKILHGPNAESTVRSALLPSQARNHGFDSSGTTFRPVYPGSAQAMMSTLAKVPVIILTALPLEYAAVLRHLTDPHEVELRSGTLVEVGTFAAKGGKIQVGVVEVGAGNVPTAATAQEVFSHFEPATVLFVGVAGGLKDVRVGDVVAATRVYGFESGKAADEFLPRADVGQSSYRLLQRARAEARQDRWLLRLESGFRIDTSGPTGPPSIGAPADGSMMLTIAQDVSRAAPRVLVGPIAAGSQVVASTRSPIFDFLVRQYSDAVAVEMEGRGFLEAAWRYQLDALVVRGISDLIEKKAESDAAGSQPRAAQNAATFAFEVIANLTLT